MPRTHAEELDGFAHCPDARCDGYRQEPVRVVRETVEFTYAENGGDMPGVERSFVYLKFADPALIGCPSCERRQREVSLTPRKVYENLSGYAQDGLLVAKGM